MSDAKIPMDVRITKEQVTTVSKRVETKYFICGLDEETPLTMDELAALCNFLQEYLKDELHPKLE